MFRFSWIIRTSYHVLQQKLKSTKNKVEKHPAKASPRDHMGIWKHAGLKGGICKLSTSAAVKSHPDFCSLNHHVYIP